MRIIVAVCCFLILPLQLSACSRTKPALTTAIASPTLPGEPTATIGAATPERQTATASPVIREGVEVTVNGTVSAGSINPQGFGTQGVDSYFYEGPCASVRITAQTKGDPYHDIATGVTDSSGKTILYLPPGIYLLQASLYTRQETGCGRVFTGSLADKEVTVNPGKLTAVAFDIYMFKH